MIPRSFVRLCLAALVAVCLGAALSGCGTPATVARKTVTGFELANASAPGLARPALKICHAKSVEIARDSVADGRAQLASCVRARQIVQRAMHTVLDATGAAESAIDAAEALGAKDYQAALAPAVSALQELWAALRQAGVTSLPKLPGVQ